MRQGEILQLKWDQIDFKNQLAHLKETKNGRPRSVPLVDEVVEELKRLHENKNPNKALILPAKQLLARSISKNLGKMLLIAPKSLIYAFMTSDTALPLWQLVKELPILSLHSYGTSDFTDASTLYAS